MEDVMRFLLFAVFLCCFAAAGNTPVIHYRFTSGQGKTVQNLSSPDKNPLLLEGNVQIDKADGLALDGRTTGGEIRNSGGFDYSRGATFSLVFRLLDLPGDSEIGKKHDAFFYQTRNFVFSKRGNSVYINFGEKGKWKHSLVSGNVFQPGDTDFHHAAVTILPVHRPDQGEKWTQVNVFLDGVQVYSKRIENFLPENSKNKIEFCKGSSFGEVWRVAGNILEGKIYKRVLSAAEIANEVRNCSRVVPRFAQSAPLTDEIKKMISAREKSGDFSGASALRNAAFAGVKNLQSAKLIPLATAESTLTLIETPERVFPFSWYDNKSGRELFQWNNTFFVVCFNSIKFVPQKSSFLQRPTVVPGGGVAFKLRFSGKGHCADSSFFFDGKVLSYDLATSEGGTLAVFPAVRLAPMTRGCDYLLTPFMSGVAHKDASKRYVSYSQPYPAANASMQVGALYDDAGGVLIASADPFARRKEINFSAGAEVSGDFEWTAVRGKFIPGCRAHLELFRGDWVDAAKCYRRMLEKIKAPWILPKSPTPAWFLKNNLWVEVSGRGGRKPWLMDIAIRKFMEQDYAVHLYRYGAGFDKDYPYASPSPHLVEYRNVMVRHGIRTMPYLNARLWELRDRRDEDWTYSAIGLPAAVKDVNLTAVLESYNKTLFSVICPETEVFKKIMTDISVEMCELGMAGIYHDQVGAARSLLCYDPRHGHTPGDNKSWFRGQFNTFRPLREFFHKHYPDVILTTEDNAETCVANYDGALSWRWMNEGQVPFYSSVYAGKVQLFGLQYRKMIYPAAPYMLAWQLVCGAQLGRFTNDFLFDPNMGSFTKWCKKLIHLRKAVNDFIVNGNYGKTLKFAEPVGSRKMFWGTYGDRNISSYDLYTAHWVKGNEHAVVLLNPTDQKVRNTLLLPEKTEGVLYMEKSRKKISGVTLPFELEPQSCALLLVSKDAPKHQLAERCFAVIKRAGEGPELLQTFTPGALHPYWLPDEEKDFVVNAKGGMLKINTGKFSCVFFPRRIYPVWFQHKGKRLKEWRGNDIEMLQDRVYRAEFDVWAERRILWQSEGKITVETSGYLCSAGSGDKEPNPRRRVVIRFTFEKGSPVIRITGNVNGDHFSTSWSPAK